MPADDPSSDALLLAWAEADAAYQIERDRVQAHLARDVRWLDLSQDEQHALAGLYAETEAAGKTMQAAHAAVAERARALLAAALNGGVGS